MMSGKIGIRPEVLEVDTQQDLCAGDRCMLWVELGNDLGCCGYSQEAAWALFSREEKP